MSLSIASRRKASSPEAPSGAESTTARSAHSKGSRRSGKGLTRAEKPNKADERPTSASTQSLIPFEAITPEGIVWLGENEWSVTMELGDLSYLVSPRPVQEAILGSWARWLNSFGDGSSIQQTVTNEAMTATMFGRIARVPLAGDALDHWRDMLNQHVTDKLSTKRGNVRTRRFVTVTITEEDADKAVSRLNWLVREAQNNLRSLDTSGGVTVHQLNRAELATLLAQTLRPGTPFKWREADLADPSVTTRDLIAPDAISLKAGRLVLRTGDQHTHHRTIWLRGYPSWMSDRLVTDLATIRGDVTVSLHARPYEVGDGLDLVRGQIASLEMQLLTEQRKAAKSQYSVDLIPHALVAARDEAIDLRRDLETSNERVWSALMVVGISADSEPAVDALEEKVIATLRRHSCVGERVSQMRQDAFKTELPVGARRLAMERTVTSSTLAAMHPFTNQELMVPGGQWYGANKQSGNPVLASRMSSVNGNGIIAGTSGSGKSFTSKFEATTVVLNTSDDVIILDPEREYVALTRKLGGEVVEISAAGEHHINALDLSLDSIASDPILAKSHFVLGLMEALIGGHSGLTAAERSIIDRSTVALLRRYAASPDDAVPPTLADLRAELAANGSPEAAQLALAMELYTEGSLSAFAQQTNVDLNGRLLCYDLAQLSGELRPIAMMIILDQIWGRVTSNRNKEKRTWLYIDEFHLFFNVPETASAFLTFYKRARKYGLMVTGITQNMSEVMENPEASLMLANADFLLLGSQDPEDAKAIAERLSLSDEQMAQMLGIPPGEALLKSGNSYIAVDNIMDTSSEFYRTITTKLGESQ